MDKKKIWWGLSLKNGQFSLSRMSTGHGREITKKGEGRRVIPCRGVDSTAQHSAVEQKSVRDGQTVDGKRTV
jgi:hypothetical protein